MNTYDAAELYQCSSFFQGVVYLKYQSQAAATLGRTAMHGRFFGGKQIVAQFVPEETYHARYPDAARAAAVLKPN